MKPTTQKREVKFVAGLTDATLVNGSLCLFLCVIIIHKTVHVHAQYYESCVKLDYGNGVPHCPQKRAATSATRAWQLWQRRAAELDAASLGVC